MLVTRTPLRITLGGGGTDLPSYYREHGGFLVSAAIDKYVYILLNPRFEDSIRVSYSKTEIAKSVDDIEHPIVREALRLTGIDRGLEIVSVADLPANTGLGSSSSFTVGLLKALHTYKGEHVSPHDLAEEAFHIEVDLLKEPIGKQDQYISAFGGVASLDIQRDGQVTVESLGLSPAALDDIEHQLLLFYTGVQRRSSEVLEGQDSALSANDQQVVAAMRQIHEIGYTMKSSLEQCDLNQVGHLLRKHWEAKKCLSPRVSSDRIERWYDIALANGALGGKIMGAGGGGFFMLCCENNMKNQLRGAMEAEGLREMRYSIDSQGSKVVVDF